jgi:hypothetical protein
VKRTLCRISASGIDLRCTEKVEISCGIGAFKLKEGAIRPTSTHADRPGKRPWVSRVNEVNGPSTRLTPDTWGQTLIRLAAPKQWILILYYKSLTLSMIFPWPFAPSATSAPATWAGRRWL